MRALTSLALALVVGASLPAYAQEAPAAPAVDPRAAEAKQRYENGMAHFNLEEWDAAIDEWKSGYRAKPVAQFLYNIAQAYRLSKHYEEALNFYQRYLRADPKAPNRVEVEGHITKLTNLLQQERRTATAPPTQTLVIKPKGSEGAPLPETVQPSPAPQVAVVAPPPATTTPAVVVTKEPEKVPITKKKWFWPVIGAVAGVVVVAVVVGAAVGATSGGGTTDNTKVLPLARF
jgi:tetratricopeptide (TPR) repeat protein